MNISEAKDFAKCVGLEFISCLESNSLVLGLTTSIIANEPADLSEVWPEHVFYTDITIVPEHLKNLSKFIENIVYSSAQGLAVGIDRHLSGQIIDTLKSAKQIVPDHVMGPKDCFSWAYSNWRRQRTRHAGRAFIMSPQCETFLLKNYAWHGDSFHHCCPELEDFSLKDAYLLTALDKYQIVFQKQAITITSTPLKLECKPENVTILDVAQNGDLCVNTKFYYEPRDDKHHLRFEWIGSITQYNLNHCCLIDKEQFTAKI